MGGSGKVWGDLGRSGAAGLPKGRFYITKTDVFAKSDFRGMIFYCKNNRFIIFPENDLVRPAGRCPQRAPGSGDLSGEI